MLQLADSIHPEAVSATLTRSIADIQSQLEDAQADLEDILARSKGRKTKALQAAQAAVTNCEDRLRKINGSVPALREGWSGCHPQYRMTTARFIRDVIAGSMVKQRVQRGLPPADNEVEAMEIQDQLDPDEREFSWPSYR